LGHGSRRFPSCVIHSRHTRERHHPSATSSPDVKQIWHWNKLLSSGWYAATSNAQDSLEDVIVEVGCLNVTLSDVCH
jgi:hypothetical protein